MKKSKILRISIVLCAYFLIGFVSLYAQPGDPPGGGGGGGPVGGAGVPIDGGILSFLLFGGMMFSLFGRKIKKEKEEKR